jgi:HAD domain in Swiss Army Knife RNA repair proteins
MKILFLDFDGVLNSGAFIDVRGYAPGTLDQAAVARLNDVLARTGARVVVSSTWRLGYSIEQLRDILGRHGFEGEVIGVTPRLGPESGFSFQRTPRGREVQAWLDAQAEPPEAIAIVDDDEDMAHLDGRLVRTDFETGLLDEHVERLVALLGG